jgi:uncharacterized coiled-coil DUF342 family protein
MAKESEATAAAGSAAPWLEELEKRVQEAVAEIARLRQENRRLEREAARLRKKAEGGEEHAAWQRERDEVRSRVEKLAAHLEQLLGGEEGPAVP